MTLTLKPDTWKRLGYFTKFPEATVGVNMFATPMARDLQETILRGRRT